MIDKHYRAGKFDARFTAMRYAPRGRRVGAAFFIDGSSVAGSLAMGLAGIAGVVNWTRGLPAIRSRRDKILGPLRKFREATSQVVDRIPFVITSYDHGRGSAERSIGVVLSSAPTDFEVCVGFGRRAFGLAYVRKIPLADE